MTMKEYTYQLEIEKIQSDIQLLTEEFAEGIVNKQMIMNAIEIKLEEIQEYKLLL